MATSGATQPGPEQELQRALQRILPGANLQRTVVPGCRGLELYLLGADYPQQDLDTEQARRVMDNPLYWVFCWASGQVLARHVLDNPEVVKGKRVLDFGCGSGVVAIAAAMAGAREVVACDIDPLALAATALNSEHNDVDLVRVPDFDNVDGDLDLILVADVLYDRENFPWLERFIARAASTLIADSRVKDFAVPPFRAIARSDSCTLPDLDESAEFRDVRLYLGQ